MISLKALLIAVLTAWGAFTLFFLSCVLIKLGRLKYETLKRKSQK